MVGVVVVTVEVESRGDVCVREEGRCVIVNAEVGVAAVCWACCRCAASARVSATMHVYTSDFIYSTTCSLKVCWSRERERFSLRAI